PELRIAQFMIARVRRGLSALRPAARRGAAALGRTPRSFDPLAAWRVPLDWLPSRYMAHSLIVVLAIIAMEANALGGAPSGMGLGCVDNEVLNPTEIRLEASLAGAPAPAGSPAGQPDVFAQPTITRYTVAAGDSLWAIADRHGVSLETIRWANGIDDPESPLKIGTELTILPVSGMLHTVQPGETLRLIANAYDSDLRAIASINQLPDANTLAVGQQIIVPGGTLNAETSRTLASVHPAPPEPSRTAPVRPAVTT